MCGLVSLIGDINNTTCRKMMQTLLFLDTVRGRDSTGIFSIDYKTNEVDIFKKAYPAPDFLELNGTQKFFKANRPDMSAIVGHNRAATKGKVTSANAHPFQHGDITLVHNGTLRNEHKLASFKDHSVDSEMLCDDINRRGIEEVLKDVDGAFALIWHDASDNTLNIIRNSERPLYMGVFEEKTYSNYLAGDAFIAVASEAWMLEGAASASGATMVSKELVKFEVGKLITIDIDGVYLARKASDIPACLKEKKLELYSRPKYVGGNTHKPPKTKSKGLPEKVEGTKKKSKVEGKTHGAFYCFTPDWAFDNGDYCTAAGKTLQGVRVRCNVTPETAVDIRDGKIRKITARMVAGFYEPINMRGAQNSEAIVLDATDAGATIEKK